MYVFYRDLISTAQYLRRQPRCVCVCVYIYMRCDNLIVGMATACRWGVESGKLMYPSTCGHVPICVYMSHRPNESFVPKQQRKQHVSVVHCCVGGNMSGETLEQRINIKFCVKTGKSASETLALLTVTYGEYVMKKSNIFNG
jgi:hypothetical protein